MSQNLEITQHASQSVPGVTVARVTGVIDSDTSPAFEKELEKLLEQKHYRLLVDLASVSYISSAGIGIFVSMLQRFRSHDRGDIKVCNASKKIRLIFETIGLSDMMEVLDSEASLQAWQAAPKLTEPMDHFELSAGMDAWAGEPFTLKVLCRDSRQQSVPDYKGRPRLSSTQGLIFPNELSGFKEGCWEGGVIVTSPGRVTLTLTDGRAAGTLELDIQARPNRVQFPLAVACHTCQNSLTVREPDIYRCEQCDEMLYVDAWGHVFTLKSGSTIHRKATRYKGLDMKINADANYLSVIRRAITGLCEKEKLDEVTVNAVALAVEEILLNLIEHGNDFDPWQIFRLKLEFQKKQLKIQIRDYADPFDIRKNKDLSLKSNILKGMKRGVGGFLVNQIMDEIKYQTYKNYNQLTMIKQYAPKG